MSLRSISTLSFMLALRLRLSLRAIQSLRLWWWVLTLTEGKGDRPSLELSDSNGLWATSMICGVGLDIRIQSGDSSFPSNIKDARERRLAMQLLRDTLVVSELFLRRKKTSISSTNALIIGVFCDWAGVRSSQVRAPMPRKQTRITPVACSTLAQRATIQTLMEKCSIANRPNMDKR